MCALLLIAGATAAAARLWLRAQLPTPAAPPVRLSLPGGGLGIWSGGGYAYLLRCPDGGVLAVDAGGDANAAALKAALESWGRSAADVRAVLLTHGHAAQRGGSAALGSGPVYVGTDDWLLAVGQQRPRAPWPRLAARLRPGVAAPQARLRALGSATRLQLCGLEVDVVPLPGHTAGSLAYRIGNTTFVGDALRLDRLPPTPQARWLNALPDFAELAPSRLELLPAAMLADAHTGIAPAPPAAAWAAYGAARPAATGACR